MLEYQITDILEQPERGLWCVVYQVSDGSTHSHIFPKDALEWRAAEYGLTDIDEVIDILLHEPFTWERAGATDMVSTLHGPPPKPAPGPADVRLYDAENTTQARDAHRARIAAAKTTARVTNPPSDPLQVLRERHGITDAGLRAKRERVDVTRWTNRYGGLPVPVSSLPEVPRA